MLVAAALIVGAVWQFLLLAGQQWAGDRGIGVYPGYSLYQYVNDIPPATPTMPPYWAARLSDPHFSALYTTAATPTPPSSSPIETGTIPAPPATTMAPFVGTEPSELTATASPSASDPQFAAPPPAQPPRFWALHLIGYRVSLLLASLFLAIGRYATNFHATHELLIRKKPVIITKKRTANLPPELELSAAIAILAAWYPLNIPLPASPVEETPTTYPSANTQTEPESGQTTPRNVSPPASPVSETPYVSTSTSTQTQPTYASASTQTNDSQLIAAMISEDMHTALQENARTLRSRDDEIAQLAARCQQLEIERRTNLSEIARLRGALTIERQQGQQARPQGYGVHQGQVPAPGWPNEGQQEG